MPVEVITPQKKKDVGADMLMGVGTGMLQEYATGKVKDMMKKDEAGPQDTAGAAPLKTSTTNTESSAVDRRMARSSVRGYT